MTDGTSVSSFFLDVTDGTRVHPGPTSSTPACASRTAALASPRFPDLDQKHDG
jgi:hypothetical protein